jgi:dephospho-CoA kinase
MKCFALTGGIASGKSSVASLLKKAGITVIDADILARNAVAPGSQGLEQIKHHFGAQYLNAEGGLDRHKMAELIFGNPEAKKQLEAIVHPLVGLQLVQALQTLGEQGVQYAVYEAPLIFELGIDKNFAATILVTLPRDRQIQRLMARDGITREQALARIDAQMPLEQKEKLTPYHIDNSGTLEQTALLLQNVWHELTSEELVA